MKKRWICCFLGAVLFIGTFPACSNKKEPEAKKGAIEKMTDKAAKDVVNTLRAPMDKARSAAKQEEDRIKEMDKAAKNE